MKSKFAAVLILISSLSGRAALVTWDGGGDGVTWSDPINWNGNLLPTTADDVVIGAGAPVILSGIYPTVLSVQSGRPLSITSGALSVTAGASEVKGALTLAQGTSLTVNGAGATFLCTNFVTADGASLQVNNGGRLTLPALQSVAKIDGCYDMNWRAFDANSVLNLAGVTNIYGGNCGGVRMEAYAGAVIVLSNLVSFTGGGYASAYADGAGSLVDVRRLGAYTNLTEFLYEEARNSGQVLLPLVTDGSRIRIIQRNGGVLDTAQLKRVGGVTVENQILSLPAVTNIDASPLEVRNNGRLSFPLIKNISKTDGCYDLFWQSFDVGSVLDLSGVTNIYDGNCGGLRLRSFSGGQITLSNLVSLPGSGYVEAYADGAGSLIDLRKVASFTNTIQLLYTEARNSGQVFMPLMVDGGRLQIILRNGGLLDTAQLKRVGGVTVENQILSLPAVTNIDASPLEVRNNGRLSFPLIKTVSKLDGCYDLYWQSFDAGSVLDLSGVTNIYDGNCGGLRIRSFSGGQITLSNLVSLPGSGYVEAYADGAGSLIDLRKFSSFTNLSQFFYEEARNSGQVLMPLLVDGTRLQIVLRNGGLLDTAQLKRVAGVTVDNVILALNALTNADAVGLSVQNNGRLSLPLITTINKTDGCYDMYWQTYDAGSVLDLSGVTNVYSGNCGGLRVRAFSGSQVVLSNLVRVTGSGYVEAFSESAGSVIDLRKLASYTNALDYLYLEARASARVIMPLMTDGTRVRLTDRNSGLLDTAQFWRLGSITVDNSTLTLTGTTNLDAASIYIQNGGTLTLPALVSVTKPPGCYDMDWQVNSAGGRLIAPALTSIASGNCGTFYLRAFTGSQLILSNLTGISGGSVQVLSDGTGSLLDLTKLNSYIAPNGLGSFLTTQNGGSLSLGAQAFLLANVTLNIQAGHPFLPPFSVAGPNLTLYGTPWHSYLIENRTTLIPNADWQLSLRVPLTNVFQVVGGAPAANTAYRVSELITGPGGVMDFFLPNNPPLLIFYGFTNQTYQIETRTNLVTGMWTTSSVVTMSNTFRFLGPVSKTEPLRFYRAKQP